MAWLGCGGNHDGDDHSTPPLPPAAEETDHQEPDTAPTPSTSSAAAPSVSEYSGGACGKTESTAATAKSFSSPARSTGHSTTVVVITNSDDQRTTMCRKLTRSGMTSEDKATSTDDELLGSSPHGDDTPKSEITAVAQLWGADLVGLNRPRHLRPHRRALHHQESISSASDVSRSRPPPRLKKQRTTESCDADRRYRVRSKELRRQWTTDSSDSGYSKGYSRERLRRQDTEESVESSRRFIKELQRQPTTESSSSLRLTRQSSLRSGSDNQSLYLMRQSTIETYDEFSTTDFSRPQSSNSAAHTVSPSIPPTIHIESPHCSRDGDHSEFPVDTISYIQAEDPIIEERIDDDFAGLSVIPATVGAPLLMSTSCSLINLSAIELEASQINEIQRSLMCVSRLQKANARRKKRREIAKKAAKVCKSRAKTRPTRNKDELPKKVRWSIMATGLVLFLMSIILVGATLRMAPLIDEMGEYSLLING